MLFLQSPRIISSVSKTKRHLYMTERTRRYREVGSKPNSSTSFLKSTKRTDHLSLQRSTFKPTQKRYFKITTSAYRKLIESLVDFPVATILSFPSSTQYRKIVTGALVFHFTSIEFYQSIRYQSQKIAENIKQEYFGKEEGMFLGHRSTPSISNYIALNQENEDEDLENAMDTSSVDSVDTKNGYLSWWLPPWVRKVISKNTLQYERIF